MEFDFMTAAVGFVGSVIGAGATLLAVQAERNQGKKIELIEALTDFYFDKQASTGFGGLLERLRQPTLSSIHYPIIARAYIAYRSTLLWPEKRRDLDREFVRFKGNSEVFRNTFRRHFWDKTEGTISRERSEEAIRESARQFIIFLADNDPDSNML